MDTYQCRMLSDAARVVRQINDTILQPWRGNSE